MSFGAAVLHVHQSENLDWQPCRSEAHVQLGKISARTGILQILRAWKEFAARGQTARNSLTGT